jgi:NAD(P)-dependent dehydrogenase (short-subunit alcohol dehydrogenase family)
MVKADTTALVVSGTADSGRALVRTVADAGGTVGFTFNASSDTADELLGDLPGDGHEAWQCDVTDPEATSEMVDDAVDALGTIDAVVFTVGVISRSSITETAPPDWQDHLDANVTGAYNLLSAVGPHLEEQGDGAFVAVSASQGILNSPNLAAYDASKKGLESLVQEAARELGPAGVRANVVAPGFIRDPDALSEDQKRDLLDQQPYERLTTPQDVANACLYLCSADAATVTGAVLPVDSGLALD